MDFPLIKELEHRHAIKTAARQSICFVRGEGNRLFDTNNRSYLDFSCGQGESCLGYGGAVSDAVVSQTQNLISVSAEYFSHQYGQVLAKLIYETGFAKAALTGGAGDAIGFAMRAIWSHLLETGDTRRRVVIATNCGCDLFEATDDGKSDGKFDCSTENKTGCKADDGCDNCLSNNFGGFAGGTSAPLKRVFVPFNNFEALKKELCADTAVLIIQPILARDVKIADYNYILNVYALCKSMDILLFCDETRIGFGRTGKRFACENYGIQPDIITLSRGLAGGLPSGAVLVRENIAGSLKADCFSPVNQNLLSIAAADIVLDSLSGDFSKEITEKGEYLMNRLCKLTKHNFVLDVRGTGLLAAVELSGRISAAKAVGQLERMGFLFSCTQGNIIRLSPSFTVTTAGIDEATDALAQLFADTNI